MQDYLVDVSDVPVPSCYPFTEDMPYAKLQEFRDVFFRKVLDSSQCLLLMGPRGAGKTTFLRSFFSSSVRLNLFIEQGQIVTSVISFPSSMQSNQFFPFLSDLITNTANMLLQQTCRHDELMRLAAVSLRVKMNQTDVEGFREIMSLLCNELNYSVTVVFDDFEKFVSSSVLTLFHHDILNAMVDKQMLRLISATDYDLSESSIIHMQNASRLLQKFDTGFMTIPNMSKNDVHTYYERVSSVWDGIKLGEMGCKLSYLLSGGIPLLVRMSLRVIHEQWQKCALQDMTQEDEMLGKLQGSIIAQLMNEAREILVGWCRQLDNTQVDVLQTLMRQDRRPHVQSMVYEKACEDLEARGLLRKNQKSKQYMYNCNLLFLFCQQEDIRSLTRDTEYAYLTETIRLIDGRQYEQATRLMYNKLKNPEHINRVLAKLQETSGTHPVTIDEYQALNLTKDMLNTLPSEQRIAIENAIRSSRSQGLLSPIHAHDTDYGLSVFGFQRACEYYFKHTLLDLIAEIKRLTSSDELGTWANIGIDKNGNPLNEKSDTYEFQSFIFAFAKDGTKRSNKQKLEELSLCFDFADMNQEWWDHLSHNCQSFRVPRNEVTHGIEFLPHNRAMEHLFTMFGDVSRGKSGMYFRIHQVEKLVEKMRLHESSAE